MEGRKKQGPSELRIRRAASGRGYIVRHSFDNTNAGPSWRQDEEHIATNHSDLIKHIGTHMGGSIPDKNDGYGGGKAGTPKGDAKNFHQAEGGSAPAGMRGTTGTKSGKKKGKAPGPRTFGAGVD
jgi:hypothetical protein